MKKEVKGSWEEDCVGPQTTYRPSSPISTITDLINFLEKVSVIMGSDASISVGCNRDVKVTIDGISTVLGSDGEEVEW